MNKKTIIILGIVLVLVLAFIVMVRGVNLSENEIPDTPVKPLEIGHAFSVTGIVDYSEDPSDIGEKYCSIEGDIEIEYFYTDIYDEESKWSSNIFYTKGKDTELLKEYVGEKVTVTGTFDAESHGIPYITNISVK